MMDADVVLVHGAWHGPWCWSAIVERLEPDGARCHALDLPSSGPDRDALGDLNGDVATVRDALRGLAGPTLVVAHSYGGVPVSEAIADAGAVAHVVYLTAFTPDRGESLLGMRGGEPPEWWRYSDDRRSLTAADPEQRFYNDCAPDVARAAAARLQPQSVASVEQPLRAAGWRTVRTTYVVCARDNAIPPAVQERLAQRTGETQRLDTSHSPFLSRPDELAALLRGVLARL
jgi:pimeloyl-ACP methyl ester carboxylesterase